MAFMAAPDFFDRTKKGLLFHAGFGGVRQSGFNAFDPERASSVIVSTSEANPERQAKELDCFVVYSSRDDEGGRTACSNNMRRNHFGGIKRCLKTVC
jgi:hypothetical protein